MGRYLYGAFVLLAAGFAPAAEKELHVVALYEGHRVNRDGRAPDVAAVTVDRPGKEVVLVVGAHTAVEWDITATPKTKLAKVIFGGSRRQSWKQLSGVVTEEMSAECEKQRILPISLNPSYRVDTTRFRIFVRASKQYTGLEIASFQGT